MISVYIACDMPDCFETFSSHDIDFRATVQGATVRAAEGVGWLILPARDICPACAPDYVEPSDDA